MSCGPVCQRPDLIQLCPDLDLWLKPHLKLTITIILPTLKCESNSGECNSTCVSTRQLIQKLSHVIKPHKFKSLKLIKSDIDSIHFEAECDEQITLNAIQSRLNKVSLKLSVFPEQLFVKTEKLEIGSTRHQWETYFRDDPHMNQMKAGYRPDTIHLQSLPVKWFGGERPSPNLLVKVFGTFGHIRRFHIPALDTNQEGQTFKRFSFNQGLIFEAYVQYRDYIGFVKAMDSLRGMKLVKKLSQLTHEGNQYLEYDIKVDFDKTKHLSDKSIKKRRIAREYRIKSAVDLQNLRQQTKTQAERYQNRIDLLQTRKQSAKSALLFILSLAETRVKARKQVEDAKYAEQKTKQTLLLEEVKLREKLLERRRQRLRLQSKAKFKSLANLNTNSNGNNNNNLDDSIASSKVTMNSSLVIDPSSPLNSDLFSVKPVDSCSNPLPPNNYIDFRRNQHYNQIKTNSLYKNHKKGCKFYRPRSIVIPTNNNK